MNQPPNKIRKGVNNLRYLSMYGVVYPIAKIYGKNVGQVSKEENII